LPGVMVLSAGDLTLFSMGGTFVPSGILERTWLTWFQGGGRYDSM